MRTPTCSAQVTPAMPPPTTTNFPAVWGGRNASILSDFRWFTACRGAEPWELTFPERKRRGAATSGSRRGDAELRVPGSSDLSLPVHRRGLHFKNTEASPHGRGFALLALHLNVVFPRRFDKEKAKQTQRKEDGWANCPQTSVFLEPERS